MNGRSRQSADGLSRLWRRLDPANYFDPGEVAILRAYFGLARRACDPQLDTLYEQPVDDGSAEDVNAAAGPIRLRRVEPGIDAVTDLTHAVARICLSTVQERLPQWCAFRGDEEVVVGRRRFHGPDRTFTPLNPQRLVCINWADSAPGFSWPEDYFVTLLPGFGRYVVTASRDSTDVYGVLDIAIGWFRAAEGIETGSRRILRRWWRSCREAGGSRWADVFNEGLLNAADADHLKRAVWKGKEDC
ncbi:MAG TPA: hypothetical protein PLZ79_07810 [Burkholderiales bacterium]|nr:hypothetical protein [Burkholderiaceae bacterium]HQR53162.1 hypothetical protein [Burkholderiales bacterium]